MSAISLSPSISKPTSPRLALPQIRTVAPSPKNGLKPRPFMPSSRGTMPDETMANTRGTSPDSLSGSETLIVPIDETKALKTVRVKKRDKRSRETLTSMKKYKTEASESIFYDSTLHVGSSTIKNEFQDNPCDFKVVPLPVAKATGDRVCIYRAVIEK